MMNILMGILGTVGVLFVVALVVCLLNVYEERDETENKNDE